MLANGSIAKDQVRRSLNYLTNDRLYEVIGSVFFTSNGVVTIRCSSNPVIADAMVSNPVAELIATDSSRGAGTFTALERNRRSVFKYRQRNGNRGLHQCCRIQGSRRLEKCFTLL